MTKLIQNFFDQKTEVTAKELLGRVLLRKINNKKLSGMIVETEAYVGPHDLASHAAKGKTNRTNVMFSYGGFWHVYMIYGFYYCLNIVTETKDYPSAVLIRALEPLEGIEEMKKNRKTDNITNLTSDPGKSCQAFEIAKNVDSTSAISKNPELYIEDLRNNIPENQIVKAKRIKEKAPQADEPGPLLLSLSKSLHERFFP
jgi:DNA-3-methyladenine glycosylase